MPQCPLCNAGVTDDFGLTECSNCGAQLIVHVDGRVEHSGASETAEAQDSDSGVVAGSSDPEPMDLGVFADEEIAEESDLPVSDFAPPEAEIVESAESEFSEGEFAESEFANPPALPEEPPEFAEPPEPMASVSGSPDLSDIADFGNSADSGGQSGSLRYDLVISGIDTVDVRNAFREALVDKKLMWDTDEIVRSIHNGEVRIENVSAVKAHVLISRLRMLPFKISWEQYAVHQS